MTGARRTMCTIRTLPDWRHDPRMHLSGCPIYGVHFSPPGYWAKVKAGRRPRKPLLKELSEQLNERQKRKVRRREIKRERDSVRLSPLQAQIFQRAVDELAVAEVDLEKLEITKTGVRSLGSDVATQILLLI